MQCSTQHSNTCILAELWKIVKPCSMVPASYQIVQGEAPTSAPTTFWQLRHAAETNDKNCFWTMFHGDTSVEDVSHEPRHWTLLSLHRHDGGDGAALHVSFLRRVLHDIRAIVLEVIAKSEHIQHLQGQEDTSAQQTHPNHDE